LGGGVRAGGKGKLKEGRDQMEDSQSEVGKKYATHRKIRGKEKCTKGEK